MAYHTRMFLNMVRLSSKLFNSTSNIPGLELSAQKFTRIICCATMCDMLCGVITCSILFAMSARCSPGVKCTDMSARRNFRRMGRAPKRPPSRQKKPPLKKIINCATTVFMGLGGMFSRENLTLVHPATF